MLIRYRLREGTQRTLLDWTHADPGHDNASTSRDALSGVVDFAVGDRTARVSAQWVRSLIIDVERKRIILDLQIDAPLPDFPAKESNASWRFFLETAGTAIPDWNIKATIPWLDKPLIEAGKIDQWLKRDGVTALAQRGCFPFGKLGLGALDVEEFNKVRVGLFVAPGDGVSRLAVVCMPDTRNVISHGSLTLANLTGLRFNLRNDSLRAALVGHLDASSARRDGLISPWVALFEWPLADAIQPQLLFDRIWNPLLHATAIGRRSSNAGRPWWPVARVSELKWNKGKRWQRLMFAPSAGSNLWRLLRFDFGAREIGASVATARATFAWYLDETSADPKLRTSAGAERILTFSGRFQLPVEAEPPAKKLAVAGIEVARLVNGILFEQSPSLSAWTLDVSTFAGQAAGWLGFGSVQIKFQQPPAAPPSVIEMRMVGEWTADTCDIYSQLDVSDLPCVFRMSNTGDPSPQSLVSRFDVVNAREDALQRATPPLVCRLDSPFQSGETLIDPDGSIAGKFHLRLQAEPNRDSLLQLQLTRNANVRPDGRSLYLQTRPFNFAQLRPTDFDEEAGLDFGYWRSDDPEGPQWRLPDATVEFDLPPQTVAEEMERGNRFWDVNSTTSYIDPTRPIKFRFSPPTHVKVRPGWVDRRYHRNANNLSSILEGSRVEAFDTELLYPIRLRFEIDSDRKPAIDIAESSAFIGSPSSSLPATTSKPRELAADLFADDLAEWFNKEVTEQALIDFTEAYTRLRWEHSANRAQFIARIAQFHVHDPFLPDRQLHLSKGLRARFRTPDPKQPPGSMPPIRNPLPTGTVLEEEHRKEIKAFLDPNMNWGDEARDGALRAGAIHTLEFPSELRAVLRKVGAVSAFIETLSFSTLGANAASSVSFDEGRTTFSVEVADGQVWRIRKIRLGRVALLWNKAKHVIVYERSVVPSEQFEGQQTDKRSLGWPILRKTEEYVEPIEMIRVFTEESEPERGSPGFAHSSEFITPRIYVDGAWGRDLVHGYEIPLWNTADASGFYPMPLAAINLHTATAEHSRAWHVHPEELYFYTNTQKGTGEESNNWMPFHGLDLTDGGPSRLDVCTNVDLPASDVLDQERVPSPRISSLRRKRFDLVVRTDGPANLQHGRGDTEMLAAGIDVLSFARTAATSATSLKGDSVVARTVKEVRKLSEFGARVDSLRDEVDSFRRELPALFLKCQFASCKSLKLKLEHKANKLFARLQDGARHAFPDRNQDLGADSRLDEYLARFRCEMYEWALPRIDATTPLLTEFRQLLAQAKQDTAGGIDEFNRHRDRLRRLFDVLELSVDAAGKKVVDGIAAPIQAVEAAVTALATDAGKFSSEVASWIALPPEQIKAKAAGIRAEAETLVRTSQSIKAPCLAAIRQRIEVTAQSVAEMALQIEKASAPTQAQQLADAVKSELTLIMRALERLAASLEAAPKRVTKDLLDATQGGRRPGRQSSGCSS